MSGRPLSRFISRQAIATLFLGLLATLIFFAAISALEYNKISLEFKQRAEAQISAIQSGMRETVDLLVVVNRLFSTMGEVSREQFHAFTQPLLARYPYIRALAFHRIVTAEKRSAFEASRRQQFPGFTIAELNDGKQVPARPRDQYRVVDYVEPMAGNEAAFGLNLNSYPEQVEAAQKACESGAVAATRLYRLAQEPEKQPGLAMLMPVFRQGAPLEDAASRCRAVIGYTAVALRGGEFVNGTQAVRNLQKTAEFDMSLYADSTPDEKDLAFRFGDPPRPRDELPVFLKWFDPRPQSVSETFTVAGQPWHVVISATTAPLLASRLGSLLTLICGVLGSVLAAAYMHLLATRSRRVQQLVAERTVALHEANQSIRLREQAIEASIHSIIITSATGPDYPIEYVNPAFEKMTGYSASEVIGRSCSMLWKGDHDQNGVREIISMVRQKREVKATLRTYRKDGELFWSDVYAAPVEDASGEVHHFVVAHYDITENKRYQAELEYHAGHDALTGLANRKLLQERLDQTIANAARDGHSVWILFIDIDRFKFVNDSLGHQGGDQLLKELSRRLQMLAGDTDTVARFGGDEFLLVLAERPDQVRDTAAVQLLLNAVTAPVTIDGNELFLECSAGIAIYPIHGENADTLIAHADLAMHRAKEMWRGSIQFYTPELNAHVQERLKIERALRDALERSEFLLHYQPQVDLCSGRVVGVEALLRWQHPELGLIEPARFIDIAEDSGLIVPIGEWVLRTACAQSKAWQETMNSNIRVAVNLSARQFSRSDIVETVATVLQETGLPAHLLDLELTERLMMENVEHVIDVLSALRELGVQLSIDDFGTGYSSLAYLKLFPIDVLKIDQSFVCEIGHHSSDAAISDAIISMAHSLGMRVIAEGVETDTQCEFLSRNMCDEIQGFLFSGALAADNIGALVAEGRCLPEHLLRQQKRRRTLLLVDDEPNILAALKRLMRPAGYHILTAGSGQEGLEVLEKNEVDVIVSDQRMPGMTGVEFLRTVKTLYPETVRIVLSGFTELQSVTDAVNEGALYKFLTKPWDDVQLREHIEKAFQHKEMDDENRRLVLEVRNANRELAKANRQLEEVLKQKQQKMQRDEITLDIVREALQNVPLPIVGLDEDDVVAFANLAAQNLFKSAGMILGWEAVELMPEVLHALNRVGKGEKSIAELDGARFEIVSRSMGKGTQSRGRLITFTPIEDA